MHGLVGCQLDRMCWHACGEGVSFKDVKIKISDRECYLGSKWRHAPEACAEAFGRFEKSHLVESCCPKKKGDIRLLAEALWRVPHVLGGADERARIERLCLSPNVENPFNSKVIKGFVPELRSSKCFSCFGIPMFYVYMLWTFYVRFTYAYLAMLQSAKSILLTEQ